MTYISDSRNLFTNGEQGSRPHGPRISKFPVACNNIGSTSWSPRRGLRLSLDNFVNTRTTRSGGASFFFTNVTWLFSHSQTKHYSTHRVTNLNLNQKIIKKSPGWTVGEFGNQISVKHAANSGPTKPRMVPAKKYQKKRLPARACTIGCLRIEKILALQSILYNTIQQETITRSLT